MEENNRNNFAQEDNSALKLIDIWHLVWDYKWYYVICAVVCLMAAAVHIYRSPSIYSRSAKVIIDEGAQEAAMRDLSSFTGTMSRMRYSTNVDNEVEALSSPDLMEIVSTRLGLQISYHEHQPLRTVELGDKTPIVMALAGENPASSFSFKVSKQSADTFCLHSFKLGVQNSKEFESIRVNGRLCDTLETPVGKVVLAPTLNADAWDRDITIAWRNAKAAAKRFASAMEVSISSKQTSVVVLSVRDHFPKRAEDIISCLIDVYNESWVKNRNRSARTTTSFINDRLVVIEQELGGIETDLKNYKEKNNLTDIQAISNAYLSEANNYASRSFEVNNQLSIATYIRDYLNAPANRTSLIPANSGLTSGTIESQITSYNELLLRRDNLLTNTIESNPLITDIDQSLSSIRTAILRSIDNLIATLKIQADEIAAQEKLILSRMTASTGQELELVSIERQRKVKESLYVYLLQKREENELASLMNVANTRLIMAPNGSNSPVEPRRMMIMLVALIIGCGLPFAFFYLRKVLNNTVEGKADIVDSLSMPYLAEIPLSVKKKRFARFRPNKVKDSEPRPIVVKAGRRNVINEAFRVLRTNVDLMLHSNNGCKVVMTSSMYPGSGKTFIALNLASSMAIKGSHTLLLDLDMRKGSLSNSVGAKGPGVAGYLNETVSDLDSCIVNVADNLDVIAVGTLPPNPSELLLSSRFKTLIATLRGRYDYIFIDCPPAEVVADAAIVSAEVDMTMFIVRAGLMDKRNLPAVEDLYKSGKYTRMAVVLNGLDAQSQYGRYGNGYGRYGKGYGYGYTYGNDQD